MKPSDYQKKLGMTSTEFIAHMQKKFPKYCKASNSMCNNGDEYGVALSPKAVRYLKQNGEKKEHRSRPCRLTARLVDEDKTAFDLARKEQGKTMQEAIEEAVKLYIENVKGR